MEVLIMNTSFENVCWIDNFESLIWTERYDECGDFELYIPYNDYILDQVKQDYYAYLKESDQVMIVEDIQITSDVETGSHIIISGRSLESLLERRIIWKQTTLSGTLQNGIKKLLKENLISPTISARRIDNFIFKSSSDAAITTLKLDAQYTGDNLYEVVVALCKSFNIGFIVRLNGTQMEFSLYSGTDRSYNQSENSYVVFSPNFENIINSNYLESKKTLKNVTLVAGEDSGTSRKTRIVGSASGLYRRELYTDARDIQSETEEGTYIVTRDSSFQEGKTYYELDGDNYVVTTDETKQSGKTYYEYDNQLPEAEYNDLLDRRGKEKLAENPETKSFEGQVEATQLFVYGKDFFKGDIVQIVNEYGIESRSRVTEFIRSQNETGLETYPTFSIVE